MLVYFASPPEVTTVSISVNGVEKTFRAVDFEGVVAGRKVLLKGNVLKVLGKSGDDVRVNGVRCYEEGNGVFKLRLPRKAKLAGLVLGVAITLFVLESREYVVTAILVIVLVSVLRILDPKTALSSLSSSVVFIFLAGSAFELVMKRTGLDETVASWVLKFAKGKLSLILSTIFVSSILSAIMSNTAATYVMVPIVSRLASQELLEPLLLTLVASTAIGGSLTIIGTPPNLIVSSFAKDIAGVNLDFSSWLSFGFPNWVVGIIVITILTLVFSAGKGFKIPEIDVSRKFDSRKTLALSIILATVALWSTTRLTGISSGVIGLLSILLFTITGLLPTKEIGKLRWDLVLLFGGGLTLGKALMTSGWADWIVGRIPLPRSNWELFLFLTVLLLMGTVFSSHTSAAAFIGPVMVPIGMAISGYFGGSPEVFGTVLLVMSTLSINNAMALPISTPPSAIVFSSGKVSSRSLAIYGLSFGILMNLFLVFVLKNLWITSASF